MGDSRASLERWNSPALMFPGSQGRGRGKSRMTQVSDLSNWEMVDGAMFCNEYRGRNRFREDGMFKFGPVHCLTLSHETLHFGSRPSQ